jgi:hypothetical protein
VKHRYRCRATEGMGLPSGQRLTTQPAHAAVRPSPHALDLVGLENSIFAIPNVANAPSPDITLEAAKVAIRS